MTTESHHSRIFLFYLLFTAVICGALVMVIEVMGSRVVGPFFGVSLFVWTSLITVTMLALAAGYALGGYFSDRFQQPVFLFSIILLAGVLTLLVPAIKGPVLKACMPLGLRAGAFISTTILFGPALLLLGCVSPYLVKLVAREIHNIGRVVGSLYALSTIGSTVGTIVAGFFLIAYLGIDQIFTVIGGLLIALSTLFFILFQRRWWALVFLILPGLLYQSPQAISRTMSDGTKVDLIHNEENYYGNLKVVDYSYANARYREMIIDGLVQGGIDLSNYQSIYDYNYYLQIISYILAPEGKRCLVIGLGLGIIPNWFEQQGITCDVVDINPAIVDVARKYFGYRGTGDIYIQDARYFLNETRRHYDYIVLDVFSGDITPAHLLSIEALKLMRDRLTSKGVLAVNLIGSTQQETFMTASVVRTIEAAFDQVDVFPVFNVARSKDGIGNLAIMAYQGRSRPLGMDRSRIRANPDVINMVLDNIGNQIRFSSETPAIILTDDYNPIDFFDSWLREMVRNNILQSTNWDILLE